MSRLSRFFRSCRKRDLDDPKSFRKHNPQCSIGRGTYDDPAILSWGEGASLKVGAYCSFADGVQIFLGGEHHTGWVTSCPFNAFWPAAKSIAGHPHSKGDVVIGNDVWIAANVTILSGVNIGDGAVIGAGAVVTRNIPPYAIAAGNPARVIKFRLDEATIERLLGLQWWSWAHERIEKALPLLMSDKVGEFIHSCDNGAI